MKRAFFIMRLWRTGNIGSHEIKKIELNPVEGYKTYDEAVEALLNFYEAKVYEVSKSSKSTLSVMQIFEPCT